MTAAPTRRRPGRAPRRAAGARGSGPAGAVQGSSRGRCAAGAARRAPHFEQMRAALGDSAAPQNASTLPTTANGTRGRRRRRGRAQHSPRRRHACACRHRSWARRRAAQLARERRRKKNEAPVACALRCLDSGSEIRPSRGRRRALEPGQQGPDARHKRRRAAFYEASGERQPGRRPRACNSLRTASALERPWPKISFCRCCWISGMHEC